MGLLMWCRFFHCGKFFVQVIHFNTAALTLPVGLVRTKRVFRCASLRIKDSAAPSGVLRTLRTLLINLAEGIALTFDTFNYSCVGQMLIFFKRSGEFQESSNPPRKTLQVGLGVEIKNYHTKKITRHEPHINQCIHKI